MLHATRSICKSNQSAPIGGIVFFGYLARGVLFVEIVVVPFEWVILDVFGDTPIFIVGADDMLVVIALPQFTVKGLPPKLPYPTYVVVGRHSFKPLYHVT